MVPEAQGARPVGGGAAKHAVLALQFLTRLPTPQVRDFHPEDLSRSAVWFPAVGLIVGGIVALAAALGGARDPWLGALFGTLAWTWVTGALHIDGLADLADALGAGHSRPERIREVLADPRCGSFAVVVIVLQLLTKLVALRALSSGSLLWTLPWVSAAARLGPLYWVSALPPFAPNTDEPGSGERFAWHIPTRAIPLWAVVLGLLALTHPPLLLAGFLLAAWHLFLARTLGGQTGDALGAGIEVVESSTLLFLAFLAS